MTKQIFSAGLLLALMIPAVAKTPAKPAPKKVVPQKVTVTLPDGYAQGAATVKAGKPVAITFFLKSEAGCGDEVVVPAANWRKKLSVGEKATVTYTPKKSG